MIRVTQTAPKVTQVETSQQVGAAPPDALCTQADITAWGRFSKSHLYNLIARGAFPAPVIRSGPRFTRWSRKDVEAWLKDPAAAVSAGPKSATATR